MTASIRELFTPNILLRIVNILRVDCDSHQGGAERKPICREPFPGPQKIARTLSPVKYRAMQSQSRQVSIRVPLDRLSVCRICGDLHGEVVRSEMPLVDQSGLSPTGTSPTTVGRNLRQECACTAATVSPRWDDYDFNQAVTLCRCCGRRLLMSGMRWSEWFCTECLPLIDELNARCGMSIAPTSRYTLLATIAAQEESNTFEPPKFASRLGDWFDRVELLERHAIRVIRENLNSLGLQSLATDVTLGEYLERLPASHADSQRSVLVLAAALGVPRRFLPVVF